MTKFIIANPLEKSRGKSMLRGKEGGELGVTVRPFGKDTALPFIPHFD